MHPPFISSRKCTIVRVCVKANGVWSLDIHVTVTLGTVLPAWLLYTV